MDTPDAYVHGYSPREAQRLGDQATTLAHLLHAGTAYPSGSTVLEAGCGVGAQTTLLAASSPGAAITSVDISAPSLEQARRAAAAAGLANVSFLRADLYALPWPEASFDHVFACFVLEHLTRPQAVLGELRRVLKPGGTLTAIEGDHGSCYFHPETPEAVAAWRSLIRAQAELGGDSLIGRRLYPLLAAAGLREVAVAPRMVYVDASRPHLVEGFIRRTIVPMVEGVAVPALEGGLIDRAAWERGLADLRATAGPEGTFCYTFFKALARK
jgi:SAM-dependent methyltransferase